MTLVCRLLAVSLFLLCGACGARPPLKVMESVTGQLILPNGSVCSASVLGTAIATTKHCLRESPDAAWFVEVRFRGVLMAVKQVTEVGGENILVSVDGDLGPSARIGAAPRKGDRLWLLGNVGGVEQLLREGLVAGYDGDMIVLDCACWQGDSGAGYFNARGELVGIHYGSIEWKTDPALPPAFYLPIGQAVVK